MEAKASSRLTDEVLKYWVPVAGLPTTIHEEWQSVESGDKVPSGPIAFTATIVDAPRHFVLEIKSLGKKAPRLHFTLAYELRDDPQGTRLVTRMRSHVNFPLGFLFEKLVLGPGDGIMLRRQLLNTRRNAINALK